jgi:hypothetical protein
MAAKERPNFRLFNIGGRHFHGSEGPSFFSARHEELFVKKRESRLRCIELCAGRISVIFFLRYQLGPQGPLSRHERGARTAAGRTSGPGVNTQQGTTQVLVPNGGTVVFGGVTVTQRSNSSTAIPLLGNIPILGNLFKSSNVQDTDQELLFFVSPRLLTT